MECTKVLPRPETPRDSGSQQTCIPSMTMRKSTGSTDWSVCIVCSMRTHRKHKHCTKLKHMSGTSRLRKLHMNEGTDLIAKDAVHHTHLKAKTPSSTVTTRCLYDTALYSLIEELDNDFMFNKKALLLSTLVQRYKVLLPADIDGKNYKSPRLRSRLEKHHGSEVSFLAQH